MGLNKKTVRDVDVQGKKVLVRCDFNVPLDAGNITDDRRIVGAMPTIQYLIEHGAIVILASHLGRPQGVSPEFTLAPVAKRLSELLGKDVPLLPDCVGSAFEGARKSKGTFPVSSSPSLPVRSSPTSLTEEEVKAPLVRHRTPWTLMLLTVLSRRRSRAMFCFLKT